MKDVFHLPDVKDRIFDYLVTSLKHVSMGQLVESFNGMLRITHEFVFIANDVSLRVYHSLTLALCSVRISFSEQRAMYDAGFWAAPALELMSASVLLHKKDAVRIFVLFLDVDLIPVCFSFAVSERIA
jgi:hypothetical protein